MVVWGFIGSSVRRAAIFPCLAWATGSKGPLSPGDVSAATQRSPHARPFPGQIGVVSADTVTPLYYFGRNTSRRREEDDHGAGPGESRGVTQGCFVAGTRVLLADGTEAAVEDLLPGDPVLRRPGGGEACVVMGTAGPEERPVYHVTTDSGHKVGVTPFHPMVVLRPGGWDVIPARDLRVGMERQGMTEGQLFWNRVQGVTQRVIAEQVYNVEIEGTEADRDHLIVANGVVTGALLLQRRLEDLDGLAANPLPTTGSMAGV